MDIQYIPFLLYNFEDVIPTGTENITFNQEMNNFF